MTKTSNSWPANRYRRRLPQRLRRRGFHHKSHHGSHQGQSGTSAESQEQLTELNDALQKQRDQMMRLQAEFENYRRRTRKEVEDIKTTASADLIEALIPVVDNFSHALKSPVTSLEGFAQGVQMIQNQFLSLLKEKGLEPIDAEGKTFDPKFHEAVAVDTSGEHPENQVVEVLQPGYAVRGKLVRPTLVKVSRHG